MPSYCTVSAHNAPLAGLRQSRRLLLEGSAAALAPGALKQRGRWCVPLPAPPDPRLSCALQSRLLKSLEPISLYKDRKFEGSLEEYVACLRQTTTVYVGNLAFHTTEEQIHELFGTCGPLRRIVMGLDKNEKTPCGFCFVEYVTRHDTEDCVKYLNGARLDEREVRIDFDWCATLPCAVRWLACVHVVRGCWRCHRVVRIGSKRAAT